jgi:hypothetical protein
MKKSGPKPTGPSRLVRIGVEGFKSIHQRQTLDLAPITVLAGANSSGKSSLMQPLLLLKQTLEAPFDPGTFLLSGENVKFTSADQILFRCVGEGTVGEFAFDLEVDSGLWVRLVYANNPGAGIGVAEVQFRQGQDEPVRVIRDGMASEEIEALLPEALVKLGKEGPSGQGSGWHWGVARERFYLGFNLRGDDSRPVVLFSGGKVVSPVAEFLTHIDGILHLPGLRGNPERAYPTTAVESSYPGTFERYVASVVNHWQKDGKSADRLKALSEDLRTLGLTWKVEARRIDDTQVELRVGRLPSPRRGGSKDLVNIADVGFGVSQTLPILVALRVAGPGRIVYLEQPEIHLHPNAQVALVRVIADAARRGVIVVIETHSSVLLRSIQTLVALGEVDPESVCLNWFVRDPETGATRVTTAVPDENGAYGDWPEDFDEAALKVERDYLNAIEQRLSA